MQPGALSCAQEPHQATEALSPVCGGNGAVVGPLCPGKPPAVVLPIPAPSALQLCPLPHPQSSQESTWSACCHYGASRGPLVPSAGVQPVPQPEEAPQVLGPPLTQKISGQKPETVSVRKRIEFFENLAGQCCTSCNLNLLNRMFLNVFVHFRSCQTWCQTKESCLFTNNL